MINNLEENVENIYKRKKSKNNVNFLSNNYNDKEISIQPDKFCSNEKNAKENYKNKINNQELNSNQIRFRNIKKPASKEKQRSLSSKNKQRKFPASEKKEQAHQNILTEANSEGIKEASKKTAEKIDDVYIINKYLTFVDLKNYSYNRSTAKKIKNIFRLFLENRTEFLVYNKIHNIKEDEDSDLSQESHAAYNKMESLPTEKLKNKFYYERFKQRVMSQLENEMTFKPELNTSENQSNINNAVSNKRNKLKMEDAYEYRRKKKERCFN